MNNRFSIFVIKSAQKSLEKIPLPWRERIGKAIDELENNPFYGEKMWGKLENKRKIVIRPYRVIYTVKERERIVEILVIRHRGSVEYK